MDDPLSPSPDALRPHEALDPSISRTSQTGPLDPTHIPNVGPSDSSDLASPLPSSRMSGRTLGQYELLELLGQGGMGAVYKARHKKLDKLVALKLLPADLLRNPQSVSRFEREMKAVGKIDHPHIVRAMDAGEVDGTHYLTMELVEGIDLGKLIRDRGPMSVKDACKAIRQSALGLSAAHHGGLVHRDIKPSNLLLAKNGQIKILDLGLARLSDEIAPAGFELTSSGQVLGTPDYMAPEQWEDTHTADARTDLYALGCTLFFLLTGRAPFATAEYKSVVKKMAAHVNAPIPDLKMNRVDVPDEVIAIYRKLMAKQPDDRFKTAGELARSLAPFTQSKTSELPRVEPTQTAPAGSKAGGEDLVPDQAETMTQAVKTATHNVSPSTRSRNWKRVGGLFGGVVLMAAIIITITHRDGTKTRIEVADDAKIEIAATPRSSVQQTGWYGWPADAPKPAIAPFDADQAKKYQEEWATYLKVPVEFTNTIGMKFRLIPPGEFLMGSTPAEIADTLKVARELKHWQDGIKSETPQHQVILTQAIYFGVNEVTQTDYETVMGTNPSAFAALGPFKDAVAGLDTTRHPVERVSWNDAAEFCAKLSQKDELKPFYSREGETITLLDGKGYRLPTEAEWEFACRAGTNTKYWIGDWDDQLVRAGWFRGNSGGRTHAAGELQANPLGLHDIHGNVLEWLGDAWDASYYGQFAGKPAVDPNNSSSAASQRVVRGGHWDNFASNCRSSDRNAGIPTNRNDGGFGFRIALPVDALRQGLNVIGPSMPMSVTTTPLTPASMKTGWHGWPADAPKPAIAPFDAEHAKKHQEEWAKYLNVPVEYTNTIGMKFRLIPPGEFLMGSTQHEIDEFIASSGDENWKRRVRSEAPRHQTVLTIPFFLSVHETTQGAYDAVIENHPNQGRFLDLPVMGVSWNDVTEFCSVLSKAELFQPFYFRARETVTLLKGNGYRLPTEAEWEFACRAGTTTKYSIGDSEDDLLQAAWIGRNAGSLAHSVGQLRENAFGLFDVHGNAYEWVQDGWDDKFYEQFATTPAVDPVNPALNPAERIIRGGDFGNIAHQAASATRFAHGAGYRSSIGVRPVLTVDAVRQALKVTGPPMPTSVTTTPAAPASVKTGWYGWPADAPKPAIAPFDAGQARKHQEEWAAYLRVPVEYTNTIGMKFQLIPPGEFLMGSTAEEVSALVKLVENQHFFQACFRSESPQHRVILTAPIYLGIFEVTQAQFVKVMLKNPSHFASTGQGKELVAGQETAEHPVENINWNDAAEFCTKLSQKEQFKVCYFRAKEAVTLLEGTGYRLPTEVLWEFACRSGTTTKFWIGDKDEDLMRAGWFDANSGERTHAVGELKANHFGLFDVHGNVEEICEDEAEQIFNQEFTGTLAINPKGPNGSLLKCVVKGGCFMGDAKYERASLRLPTSPSQVREHYGFRVTLPVDTVRQALKVTGPAIPKPIAKPPSEPTTTEGIDFAAERKAAEWVLKIGGTLGLADEQRQPIGLVDGRLPQTKFIVKKVDLMSTAAGDNELPIVSNLAELESLNLTFTQITDDGLAKLPSLPRLKELSIAFNAITDIGLKAAVERCSRLVELEMNTDSGQCSLKSLQNSCRDLRRVRIRQSQLMAEAVDVLRELPSFRALDVEGLTDSGVTQLIQLHDKLESLYLIEDATFSDVGYTTLATLPRLQHIEINGNPSDNALQSLATLMPLRRLSFGSPNADHRYTAAGISKFRELRPDVNLRIDGKEFPASSVIPFSVIQKLDETDPLPKWELPEGSPPPVVAPCTPEEASGLQQQWAEHLKRPVVEEISGPAGLGMKFALIPPGEFRKIFTWRGHATIEPDMPVRRFRITKPYAIGTTEVTWNQFRQFVEATGYQTEAETTGVDGRNRDFQLDPKITWRNPGWKPDPNEPVTQITFLDAEAFCAWLTDSKSKSQNTTSKSIYRLPTEAEWVHACRAGSVHKYVVGPDAQDLADYAWTREFLDPDRQASPLHLVGTKKPNPFGMHDTLGNVWEFTRDCFSPAVFPYLVTNDPLGYAGMIIGDSGADDSSTAHPDWGLAPWSMPTYNLGFRVLQQFDVEPLPGPFDRPLVLRAGQPMSVHALVPRPERIPGLRSWSVELAWPHSHAQTFATNPNGDLIATVSRQHSDKIGLWDRDGNYVRALLGHEGYIWSLDFSRDGKWLASCDVVRGIGGQSGSTVRLWNVETGALYAVIPLNPWLPELVFSPNSKQLAVSPGIAWGPTILLFDLASGQTRTVGSKEGRCPAWSPDGSKLACSDVENRLWILDAKSLEVVLDAEVPFSGSLQWSPDGQKLAMQHSDGTVTIRDAQTLKVTKTLGRKPWTILSWLPDSKQLVVVPEGVPGGIFDTATGEQLTKFDVRHSGGAVFDEGKQIVFDGGGRLQFYDTTTGQKLREGKELGRVGGTITFAPHRGEVYVPGGGHVTVFEASTGKRLRTFNVPHSWPEDGYALYPSFNRDLCAIGAPLNRHPVLVIVDSQTGAKRKTLSHGQGNVMHVAWSPDGERLATGASDNLIRIWNVATGNMEQQLAGHTDAILSLAWSPDGMRLASGSNDKSFRIWDPKAGNLVATYDKFPEGYSTSGWDRPHLAWSADNRQLWMTLTHHIAPLDVETGTFGPLENFSNGNALHSLNVSPDYRRLLVREDYGWTFLRGRDAQDRRLLGNHLGESPQWHSDSRRFLGWEVNYGTIGFDVEKNQRLGMLFPWVTGDHWLCIGPTGHYRGSPGVDDQIVYVAMLEDGSQLTYTPAEFAQKFGWKNDPDKATLLKLDE